MPPWRILEFPISITLTGIPRIPPFPLPCRLRPHNMTENANAWEFPFMKRLIIAVACGLCGSAGGEESKTWQQFVEARRAGTEPIVPDFSYSGYHGGDDAIPDVAGPVFDVSRYGAKGDGQADDQNAIQKADRCRGSGRRRGRLLPAGNLSRECRYGPPSTDPRAARAHCPPRQRGHAGRDRNPGRRADAQDRRVGKIGGSPSRGWRRGGARVDVPHRAGKNAPRTLFSTGGGRHSPRGVHAYRRRRLTDPSRYVGHAQRPRQSGRAQCHLAPYKVSDLPAEWTRIHNGIGLQEQHKVASVEGSRVTLREPVKTAILAQHGWTLSEYSNIAEIGIEDICFEGAWLGKFVHHRSVMDDVRLLGGVENVPMWSTPGSGAMRVHQFQRPASGAESRWPYCSFLEIVLGGKRWDMSRSTTIGALPACSTG